MSETAEAPQRILPLRITPDGWAVLTLHWSANEDYDYEAACQGQSEEDIRTELEIDWSATKGKRVYPQFSRQNHVATEALRFEPSRPLHIGWDWGKVPACCITQVNVYGQWLIFPSLSPPETASLGVYEFASMVADHLLQEYAAPHGLDLEELKMVHVGDPAGQYAAAKTGLKRQETKACFDVLYGGSKLYLGEDDRGDPVYEERPGWKWRVIPGPIDITRRLESVRSRLTTTLNGGLSALVVDPRAEMIITGFLGSYAYKQYTDGSYSRDPDKNAASHTFDALGYTAARLFARPPKSQYDEDEDEPKPQGFRSHAASRRW